MILTRDMTPRVLSYKSRDFQLLCTYVDLMANSIKLDIEYLPNLINPAKCKSTWLEVLGSLVGYPYDETLSTEQNRFVISNYKSLTRLRGSQRGVEFAVAIYLKLIGRDDTDFRVTIPTKNTADRVQGVIYINDEMLDLTKVPLLSKLLELVRPVGVSYVLQKASVMEFANLPEVDQKVWTYQTDYPIDKSTEEDRSVVHTGDLLTDDEDNEEFTIGETRNLVGSTVASDNVDKRKRGGE